MVGFLFCCRFCICLGYNTSAITCIEGMIFQKNGEKNGKKEKEEEEEEGREDPDSATQGQQALRTLIPYLPQPTYLTLLSLYASLSWSHVPDSATSSVERSPWRPTNQGNIERRVPVAGPWEP